MVPECNQSLMKHLLPWTNVKHPDILKTWIIKIFLLLQVISSLRSQALNSDSTNASQSHAQPTPVHSTTTAFPNEALTLVSARKWNVKCKEERCTVCFNSSEVNVKTGLGWTKEIFLQYKAVDCEFLSLKNLELMMKNIGIFQPIENEKSQNVNLEEDSHVAPLEDDVSNSDFKHKESQVDEESGEGAHDHDQHVTSSFEDNNNRSRKYQCIKHTTDVCDEYYPDVPYEEVKISLSDLYLILPRLLHQLSSPVCASNDISAETDKEDHEHDMMNVEIVERSRLEVWGITLLSVAIISLLSVIGILIVPLMGRSKHFHRLLAFLVALAVGTLIGDALLHLLPHTTGGHEEGHDHGGEAGDEEEKDKIIKSLVAVLGIYFFFVFESIMSMIRKLRQKRRYRASIDVTPKLVVHSPSKSDDFLTIKTDADDPLLNTPDSPSSSASNRGDDVIIKSTDSGISSTNTAYKMSSQSSSNSLKPLGNGNAGSQTPSYPLELNHCTADGEESKTSETKSEEAHDHDHGHHHHGDIANAQGIKDLAWMIIAGDGLHNFSDGLAIGAAFSSSVSAGLSTSLAIFCHELPHELGDFAILIDAGMSIKKAILYNGLSACLAFIGAFLGLLIGEYTSSVKLWILAVTAGGFLYVGLVDMLPQMLRQCTEKDGFTRFIYQNIGFLAGLIIMLLIAWYEEAFKMIF